MKKNLANSIKYMCSTTWHQISNIKLMFCQTLRNFPGQTSEDTEIWIPKLNKFFYFCGLKRPYFMYFQNMHQQMHSHKGQKELQLREDCCWYLHMEDWEQVFAVGRKDSQTSKKWISGDLTNPRGSFSSIPQTSSSMLPRFKVPSRKDSQTSKKWISGDLTNPRGSFSSIPQTSSSMLPRFKVPRFSNSLLPELTSL